MTSDDKLYMDQVVSKVQEVHSRIAKAAKSVHRDPDTVKMVGVTKYVPSESLIHEGLLQAQCYDFGESRPQNLSEKAKVFSECDRPELFSRIRWHQIGTLQRNKIRRIIHYVSLIHSIDSLELLEAVDRIIQEETTKESNEQRPIQSPLPVLLEVNISHDETKQGYEIPDLWRELPKLCQLRHVKLSGLMGMGGLTASPDQLHQQFASLHRLRDEIREKIPEPQFFNELSMGMSHDFEIAVAEGATLVRIGSILYP